VAGIGSYTWASTATNSAGPTVATSNAIVTVSMFDVDAAAYFNRAEALGGSFDLSTINAAYTATYIKNSINNLIAGIKADGNWPLVKEFYLFSGVTFAGLMAKVKYTTTPALTNNGFTVANFIAAGSGAGLVGNASNYLSGTMTDTALGPVGGVGIFQTVIDTATNFALFGSQGTGGGLATDEYSIQKFTLERSCYGGIVNQFTNSLIDLGAHTICRQSNTSLKKVVNATTVMTDTTAITVTSRSQEFYIFRRNGASPNPTVARLSCAWLLSGAHTEVNVQAIHARVRTLMTAFGVA
jgi:PKD repeat protein